MAKAQRLEEDGPQPIFSYRTWVVGDHQLEVTTHSPNEHPNTKGQANILLDLHRHRAHTTREHLFGQVGFCSRQEKEVKA
jgi:hypothetical protein